MRWLSIVPIAGDLALAECGASASQPTTTSQCSVAWPPVLTTAAPTAQLLKRLGTKRRRDGHLQVTYNGHPSTTTPTTSNPDRFLCQNVQGFGGTWLVVSP